MKTLYFSVLSLFIAMSGFAQGGPIGAEANKFGKFAELDTIDTSNFECIYNYKVTDPIKDETREYYKIFISGNKLSKYMDYGVYRTDSVVDSMDKTKITSGEYAKISNKFNEGGLDFIIRDKQDGGITVYDRVFIDPYIYKEPQPDFNWQLSDETKTVCGNVCHKATSNFRGRNWTVWYSDIPISEGPWKFAGLPGLILEAEDSTKEISFTAISVRKMQRPITTERIDYFKTTREKFNKAQAKFNEDPGKAISASELAPRDKDGNKINIPKRRRFFNPIEKE